MKIKHIYTVVREFDIEPQELAEEKEFFFSAITDEPGEYLYGGQSVKETVTVQMQVNDQMVSY